MASDLTSGISSDNLLLTRIGEGDTEAFWMLWEKHEAVVGRVCGDSFGKRSTEAEDAYAAVRLKALLKLRTQAHAVRNARGWLIRLARNHCMDVHRKQAPEKLVVTHAVVHVHEPLASTSGAEASWFEQLDAALKSLSPILLEALLGRVQAGRSYRELSTSLNVPEAALRKRVQRAHQTLKGALSADPNVELNDLLAYLASRQEQVVDLTGSQHQSPERRKTITVVGIVARTNLGARDLFLPSDHRAGTLAAKTQKLEAYLRNHRSAWRSRATLGHLQLLSGDLQAAERNLQLCLRHHPSGVQACVDWALLQLAQNPARAADALHHAATVARDPGLAYLADSLQGVRNLATPELSHIIAAAFNDLGADDLTIQLARQDPDSVTASFLSRSLRRAGLLIEAEKLAAYAHSADASNPLACIEFCLHNLPSVRAIRLAAKLYREFPHLGQAAILLSLCHLVRGERKVASAILEAYLRREPAHGQVIRALQMLSRPDPNPLTLI